MDGSYLGTQENSDPTAKVSLVSRKTTENAVRIWYSPKPNVLWSVVRARAREGQTLELGHTPSKRKKNPVAQQMRGFESLAECSVDPSGLQSRLPSALSQKEDGIHPDALVAESQNDKRTI
jgi:hypothetical protein